MGENMHLQTLCICQYVYTSVCTVVCVCVCGYMQKCVDPYVCVCMHVCLHVAVMCVFVRDCSSLVQAYWLIIELNLFYSPGLLCIDPIPRTQLTSSLHKTLNTALNIHGIYYNKGIKCTYNQHIELQHLFQGANHNRLYQTQKADVNFLLLSIQGGSLIQNNAKIRRKGKKVMHNNILHQS